MTHDPALDVPQPICASAEPCPGCGYRRIVLVAKDETSARFRQHDMRQPVSLPPSQPKLGRCPGSGAPARAWAPV